VTTAVDSRVVGAFAVAAADVVAARAPVHRRVADHCGCSCFPSFRCSLLLLHLLLLLIAVAIFCCSTASFILLSGTSI